VLSDLVGGADDDFGDGPAAGTGDDVLDGFGDVVGVQLFDVGEADVAPGVLLPPGLGRAGDAEAARNLTRRFQAACPYSGLPGSDPVSDLAGAAAVYTLFTAEHGTGFDLIFAAELRGRGDEELMDASRAVMEPPLRAALSITGGDAEAALNLIERAFAAAHGYATLWRSGLYTDRKATVHDVASEAAAVARTLAEARGNV
jgi:hypothetical protein